MTAFGAFIKKTEINFELLNQHSLFLITGPTGSGKTTILDAITFSLFGEASGETRHAENFKSDYSDLTTLCSVDFEFELKGKKYILYRSPRQIKKSAKGNGKIIIINSKAKLILDDGSEITGVENVNQKIVELLGMTYKQFRQIVILPQGEFKKLLEAKSEDKQEIFRKIFDTDIYERFSKILLSKTREIESEIAASKLLINGYISAIDLSDDENLIKIVSQFLSDNHNESSKNFNSLLMILEDNIKNNNLIIEKIKNSINYLESNKESINIQIANVKILEDRKLRLLDLKNKFNDNLQIQRSLKVDLENVIIKLNEISKEKDEISDLIYKKNALDMKLQLFNEIEKLDQEYNFNFNNSLKILNKLKKMQMAERKVILQEDLKKDDFLLHKFNEFISSIDVYNSIFKEYKSSENDYLLAYERFLAGQAGLLAKNLLDGKACPVCGSKSHPDKAAFLTDTPSQDLVKKLSLKTRKLRDKLSNLDLNLLDNYNFIKDKIPQVSDIEYCEILKNKTMFLEIFKDYNLSFNEKLIEEKNIKIDIHDLTLEIIRQNIEMYNNLKLNIDIKLRSLGDQKNLILDKLKNEPSREFLLADINSLDEQILTIKRNYKSISLKYQEVKTSVDKNNQQLESLQSEIIQLNSQLKQSSEIEKIDLQKLKNQLSEIDNKLVEYRNKYAKIMSRINVNRKQYDNIKEILNKFQKLYRKYANYATLSDVANGRNPERISFERYILASYFQDVIDAANIKLAEMTRYRYVLKRKEDKERNNRSSGLDLEVIDNYTGKARHINTLSGGEAFKASLCLALGLADVVQKYSGGVEIDTLFIDEGFGTLDNESLDSAIEALMSLNQSGRLIGIISHVNELKERVAVKIVVTPSKNGSKIEVMC